MRFLVAAALPRKVRAMWAGERRTRQGAARQGRTSVSREAVSPCAGEHAGHPAAAFRGLQPACFGVDKHYAVSFFQMTDIVLCNKSVMTYNERNNLMTTITEVLTDPTGVLWGIGILLTIGASPALVLLGAVMMWVRLLPPPTSPTGMGREVTGALWVLSLALVLGVPVVGAAVLAVLATWPLPN